MNYDAFKQRCKDKGYSPSSLVTEIGINKSNITKWKNGSNPSYDTLIKMAEILDCTVGYLIGTEDESQGLGPAVRHTLRSLKSTPARTITIRNNRILKDSYLNEIAAFVNSTILFLCGNDMSFEPVIPDRKTAEISERGWDKLMGIFDNVNDNPTITNIQMQLSRIVLHNLGITSGEQFSDEFIGGKVDYILHGIKQKDSFRNYPFFFSDLLCIGDILDKSVRFMFTGIE